MNQRIFSLKSFQIVLLVSQMLLSDLAISMKNVAETIPCSFPKETPQEDKRHFQVVGNDFDEVFLANPVVKNCEIFKTEKISTWMRSIKRSDVKKDCVSHLNNCLLEAKIIFLVY